MVVAQPLPPAELRSLADETGGQQHVAEATADRFPERAVEARRLKERHAELSRGMTAGFWRISVMAGGLDEGSAARVAGLFCASAALDGLPYALSPAPAVPLSSCYGSTELLGALARPPEKEVPGLRLALRPDFDVTPETPPAPAGIALGDILDRNLMPAGGLILPRDSLNRHVFVCGATGSGKSRAASGPSSKYG